jgi:hypothetical protein
VSAYAGPNFPDKTKLFFLTTRQINWTTDSGAPYVGLLPIAPKDNTSVIYSAYDSVGLFVSGWDFVKQLMEVYPSQFTQAQANSTMNTPPLERTTALQRVTDYVYSDTRYTTAANTNEPRVANCLFPTDQQP